MVLHQLILGDDDDATFIYMKLTEHEFLDKNTTFIKLNVTSLIYLAAYLKKYYFSTVYIFFNRISREQILIETETDFS